jgi:outer membrane protein OmpA-like peptidoglycan-associated protein
MFYLLCIVLLSGCVSAKAPPPPAPSDNQLLVSEFTKGGLTAKETERGVVVYMPSVMFVVGSAKISDSAKDKVRFIAEICNNDVARDRNIVIEGHTDSKGSEKYNMRLSEQRVISVSQLLIQNQLDSGRIDTAWFGETKPLVPNQFGDGSDNPEGRRTNRRVEFILLNPAN